MRKKILTTLLLPLIALSLGAQEIQNIQTDSPLSPETVEDGVIFRLFADYASQVTLTGSWQLPGAKPIRMYKDRSGLWEVKVSNIPADMHSYHFVVDGVRMTDPNNAVQQRDGSVYESVFILDGLRTVNYKEAAGHHGSVSYEWYHSRLFDCNRRLAVYTPHGYNPNNTSKKYPVLYLLHGEGGDEESWISAGRAVQIFDNLIQSGRAVPMIVVMPNCDPKQQAAKSVRLPEVNYSYGTNSFVSSLINEIVPYIESNYRVDSRKVSRAIAGLGQGGEQAFIAATLYPDRFDWYGFMCSGVEDYEGLRSDLLRIKKAGFKLIWEGSGTYDTVSYDKTKFLYECLESLWMDNTLYVNNGAYDWKNWRLHLASFGSMVFRFYNDGRK